MDFWQTKKSYKLIQLFNNQLLTISTRLKSNKKPTDY